MTSAFAGGALVLLLARRRASAWRAREASREARLADRTADAGASPESRSGPAPAAGPALARPRGDEADREPASSGEHLDAADRLRAPSWR